MKYVKRSITIRDDQAEWLEKQKHLTLSGIVQMRLDELMEGNKE